MNERIKELAEQAEMSVKWGDPNNYDDYHRAMDEWEEKFAELIVRECAYIPIDMWDKAELNADVAVKIEDRIKQHFGVRE